MLQPCWAGISQLFFHKLNHKFDKHSYFGQHGVAGAPRGAVCDLGRRRGLSQLPRTTSLSLSRRSLLNLLHKTTLFFNFFYNPLQIGNVTEIVEQLAPLFRDPHPRVRW
jgi:hypothetical protein